MIDEDTTMDDDALLDSWDAHVSGRANSLDHLSNQDREVIEMLHARAWTPSPRASFTSDLRARVSAASPLNRTLTPTAPKPSHLGPLAPGRRASVPRWRRVALAAVLIAALVASIGGRLDDDPPAPTVQAPVALATPPSAMFTASPTA